MWKTRLFQLAIVGSLFATVLGAIQPSQALDIDVQLPEDTPELVTGNNTFALNLYQSVIAGRDGENVFFSPYSVSQALAMTYAGANGNTAEQMADVLGFTLDEPALHQAFNALNADLVMRGNGEANDDLGISERQLQIANALWGEQTFPFDEEFIALVDQYYGGGFNATDFLNASDVARETINQWVSDQTQERIQDILPEGVVDSLTRLILVNAIYFKNAWMSDFNPDMTVEDHFYLLDGSTVTAELMRQIGSFQYATGENYQAVVLPYQQSGMSMLVVLPAEGEFDTFEAGFDVEMLNNLTWPLGVGRVDLTLPKFEFDDSIDLTDVLNEMGMSDAFTPTSADFTGMIDPRVIVEQLFIGAVLHKAFIAVDEEGSEAAAATAVIMSVTSAMPFDQPEPVEIRVDRPFIFAIRDDLTGTILFMGRVMNPVTE